MSGDTTFNAITESNKDVIASEAKQSSDNGEVGDNDNDNAVVIAASEPQSRDDTLVDLFSIFTFPIVKFISALATVPGISNEYKVTFEVEGTTYEEVIVAKNQSCPSVVNPTSTDKVFTGWVYTDASDSQNPVEKTFNFSGTPGATTITDNLTVTATFTDKTHKVYFMSADPGVDQDAFVLFTDEVADGAQTSANVIDFPETLVSNGKVFLNIWREQDATSDFVFTTPIDADITLIPQLSDGYRVWFNSGGSAVEPEVVASGNIVSEPATPERTGYTFAGWYDNDAYTGSTFNFATPITATTTFYGKWTGTSVNYKIQYWLENANMPNDAMVTQEQKDNLSNYAPARAETRTATAGSVIEVTGVSWSKASSGGAVDTSFVTNLNTTLGSVTTPSNFTVTCAGDDALPFSTVWKSDEVEVAGNGTTVVNVYLTRDIIPWRVALVFPTPATYDKNTYGLRVETADGEIHDFRGGQGQQYISGTMKLGQSLAMTGLPYTGVNNGTTWLEKNTVINWETKATVNLGSAYMGGIQQANVNGLGTSFVVGIGPLAPGAETMRTYNNGAVQGIFAWATGKLFKWYYYYEVYPYTEYEETDIGTAAHYYADESPQFIRFNGKVYERGAMGIAMRGGTGSFGSTETASTKPAESTPYLLSGVTWYLAIYLNGTNWVQSSANSTDNSVAWYHFLNRKSYDITLNLNGGSFEGDAATDAAAAGYAPSGSNWKTAAKVMVDAKFSYYPAPVPTKANANFLGWFEDAQGTVPFDFSTKTMSAKDIPIYAKWQENPRNVAFYADTAGAMEVSGFATTVANGGFISDPGVLAPTDWGRDSTDGFMGWYVKTGNGALVPYSWDMPVVGDLKLYARWDPPYTPHYITYDTDGGGTAPTDTTAYSSGSKAVVQDGSGLSKDGGAQVFAGWRVVGGDGTLYRAGNTYVMDGEEVTLLAQYTPVTNVATLTFKQNASSTDTSQESWDAHQGATVTYPDADYFTFAKTGYTFAGWSTVALATEADAAYEPESSDTVTATTTLYAVWTANNYTLNFNANGGIDGTVLSKQVTYDSNVGSLPSASPQIPTRTGYTFTGWSNIPGVSNSADFTSAYVVNWTNTPKTVYAVWKANTNTLFRVEHYLVGADGNANLKETTKHASTTDTTAGATPNTYIHYTHSPAHPSAVASGIVAADGSLVLKLYYSINRNSVSYKITGTIPAGAPSAPDAVSDVAYGTNVNVASALSYTGYTFSGWKSNQVSGASFSMPDKNVVFTGSWTRDEEPIIEPEEPEAMPDPSTGTNENKSTGSNSVSGSVQQKLDAQTGNPFTDLANGNVPLGGLGFSGAWSLLSLLMSLVAVVISVLLLIGAFFRKNRKRGRILKIATVIVGVLTAIVWIVLDDFSLPMAWINKWTLYVGIVFIVHIVLLVVYKLRRKNNDGDNEDVYENVVLD